MIANMDIAEIYSRFLETSGVVTDTRKNLENAFFVALKGDRFNASSFVPDALEKGAGYALADTPELFPAGFAEKHGDRIIIVDDALECLQELARFHRRQFDIPVLAVTGTNGKTTTKELLNAVLSRKYNVLATFGNLNNHIGVPLTLLSIRKEHDFAIVEMGASSKGEIAFSCGLAEPTCGIITNVGVAHLQGFGSFDGVVSAKGELYDYLKEHGGTVYYNSDDAVLQGMLESREMLGVAYGMKADSAEIIRRKSSPFMEIMLGNGDEIRTSLVGDYNINNVLAAVSVGISFGVSTSDIYGAIGDYVPSNGRSQFAEGLTNRIVIDAYNANPSSMAASLRNFFSLEGDNRILILGDMLELGDQSLEEHEKILSMIDPDKCVQCYLVGKEFGKAALESGFSKDGKVRLFSDSSALAGFLEENRPENALILIKGSNGVRLDKIFDLVKS